MNFLLKMKKLTYKYGLISGGLLIFFMFSSSFIWGDQMDFVMATVIGYMTMFISFVPIYLGIKDFRNNHLIGFITLKEALKIGLGIVLIASVLYAIGWMIYYQLVGKEFMETSHMKMVEEINNSGLEQAEIEQKTSQLESLRQKFSNPFTRLSYPFAEILPLGAIIALLSSLLLMRKSNVK